MVVGVVVVAEVVVESLGAAETSVSGGVDESLGAADVVVSSGVVEAGVGSVGGAGVVVAGSVESVSGGVAGTGAAAVGAALTVVLGAGLVVRGPEGRQGELWWKRPSRSRRVSPLAPLSVVDASEPAAPTPLSLLAEGAVAIATFGSGFTSGLGGEASAGAIERSATLALAAGAAAGCARLTTSSCGAVSAPVAALDAIQPAALTTSSSLAEGTEGVGSFRRGWGREAAAARVGNQNIVVFLVILNLPAGRDHRRPDYLFGIEAAFSQTRLQILAIRWHDKNTHRFGKLAFDLLVLLHIDVEQQIMPSLFGLPQDAPRGAVVAVAKHIRMLQEFIFAHHLIKLRTWNEKIFLFILLRPSRRTRGVGDGEVQVGNNLPSFVDERRFAPTRWRRNYVDGSHSRFCTCSRAFSISAFMDNPSSVIFIASPDNPEVFDNNVFAPSDSFLVKGNPISFPLPRPD